MKHLKLKYMNLKDYYGNWMFESNNIPVSDDRKYIKPLSLESAREIWNKYISPEKYDPWLLNQGDFQSKGLTWFDEPEKFWRQVGSDSTYIESALFERVGWNNEETIYFLYFCGDVIETTWEVFKRNLKCFLLNEEGPFLVNLKKEEIVWFAPHGRYKFGTRSL